MKEGDKVYYTSPGGKTENGIIKSIHEGRNTAYVVYKCAYDWDNYQDYTGIQTKLEDLTEGWIEGTS